MSYAAFEAEIARVNDVLCSVNLLTWDSRTMMPPGGLEARAKQIATLVGIARDMATSDTLQRSIEHAQVELEGVAPSDTRRLAVEQAKDAIAVLSRIPADLISAAAELKTVAQGSWTNARAANDFATFAPYLERTMEMQRQIAQAIGYGEHPYDAAISAYEPGMSWSRLKTVYDDLSKGLLPLLERAKQVRTRGNILERSYPVEKQRDFSSKMAARFGYDFNRGRLDDAVHPFEISFTSSDVRITGRFRENWLPAGLFAVWHEAGHGMYEQGVAHASHARSLPPISSTFMPLAAQVSVFTNPNHACGKTALAARAASGNFTSRNCKPASRISWRMLMQMPSGGPLTPRGPALFALRRMS